jgi:hypothetical protein
VTQEHPWSLSQAVPLLWVTLISLLGGVASFFGKVRRGEARPWNVVELVGELTTAALAGMVTYWLARWAQLDPWATAAAVGISGHMGSRALFLFERWLSRRFHLEEG